VATDRSKTHPENWRWWSLALRGVVAILFGLVAVTMPVAAFLTLVVMFGVFAILDGVFALYVAAHTHAGGAIIARGVVSILAGVVTLVWPQISSFVLLLLIASWAVVSGGLEVVVAARHRSHIPHVGLVIFEGVLSIAFGILLFMSPLSGAIVLGLWVGAYALVFGVILLAAAWQTHSHTRHRPTTGTLAAA
jgi:uncharacterized membrane protein HdeD (DUF308 family)